jgi:class 3 adenylate cyclase
MVALLDEAFTYFDSLVDAYGVEKIRTIGDNYMVAAGVPGPRPDHAQVLAQIALKMNSFTTNSRPPLRFRIGINSGPAIAGVIGTAKFHYDLWGDMVNIASRMESQGEPGHIQITQTTYERIADRFICRPRGVINVKGKGQTATWFVEGVRGQAPHI